MVPAPVRRSNPSARLAHQARSGDGCAALASGYLAVPATTALTAAALAAAFTAATLAAAIVTLAFLATAARAIAALATAALATTTAL